MAEKKKNKSSGKVVDKHFIVDPSFIDPLDKNNSFQEVEVEEFKYYYKIHLGIPIEKDD